MSLHVWDTNTQQPLVEALRHETETFEVPPKDGEVWTASGNVVSRWNLRPSALRPRPENSQPSSPDPSVLSPDGRLTADKTENDFYVQVVSAKSREPVGDPLRHRGQITGTAFSPDGQRMLTGSTDKTARVWDARTGRPVTESLPHGSPVLSVRFGGQRHQVFTTLNDKTTWLWELPVATSQVPHWLPELAEAVGGQRLNPRGSTEPVPVEELRALTKKLTEAPPSDSYLAWAQRLLAERSQHTPAASQSNPNP